MGSSLAGESTRSVDHRIEALQTARVRPCRDVNGGKTNGSNAPSTAP
jgi:hypothetical protein